MLSHAKSQEYNRNNNINMASSSSRRSLLAALWSIVGLLTLTSFVIAIVFAYANKKYIDDYENEYNYYNDYWGGSNDQQRQQQGGGSAISVTSRAMVFAAIWTAVLSGILVIYGTVILGIRMPITGKYYACCVSRSRLRGASFFLFVVYIFVVVLEILH